MAYVDIYTAATDDTHILRKQIAVALQKAATDIVNESAATQYHAERLSWARRVRLDPAGTAVSMIWRVLEDATVGADPANATDAAVQNAVNSLIDAFARG